MTKFLKMQLCEPHRERLFIALRDLGLSEHVAKTNEEYEVRANAGLEDPMAVAQQAIGKNVRDTGTHLLTMTEWAKNNPEQPACPICILGKESWIEKAAKNAKLLWDKKADAS